MNRTLASLALAFCFLSTPPVHAESKECALFNESHFLDVMLQDDTIKVLKMKDEDAHKFIGLLNQTRVNSGLDPINPAIVLIGVLENNPDFMGLAYFDADGCVLPDGVQKYPSVVLLSVFKSAGVSENAFVELTRS